MIGTRNDSAPRARAANRQRTDQRTGATIAARCAARVDAIVSDEAPAGAGKSLNPGLMIAGPVGASGLRVLSVDSRSPLMPSWLGAFPFPSAPGMNHIGGLKVLSVDSRSPLLPSWLAAFPFASTPGMNTIGGPQVALRPHPPRTVEPGRHTEGATKSLQQPHRKENETRTAQRIIGTSTQ